MDLTHEVVKANIEAESTTFVHQDRWTIADTQRSVLFEHPPTSITYQLRVDRPITFTSALSISPAAWDKDGDGVSFEVYVASQHGDAEERIFAQYVDPKHNLGDRRWIPVELSLSQYVGKQIKLRLVTTPGPAGDNAFDWAGWAEPTIQGASPTRLRLIYDGPNRIYANEAALPRAWVVHQVTQVAPGDQKKVTAQLDRADFDPASQAIVEGILPGQMAMPSTGEKVSVTAYEGQRVEIAADLDAPGLLVLSDMFYPGWQAYVDGARQPIFATNLIMRGIYLPRGKHAISFTYRPATWTGGLGVAGATAICIFAGITWPAASARMRTAQRRRKTATEGVGSCQRSV
jgi:hypothetical protein